MLVGTNFTTYQLGDNKSNTYSLDILKGVQLRAETTVDTEELLVHNRRQRQRTEGFDARLIDPLAILVFTLQLEREVVCQVATLVVTPQQPKRVGIPDLQSPEIQNALRPKISFLDDTRSTEIRPNKGEPTSILK